jgi:transcriptional regulator with XRE-family HTH domain
MDKDTTIIPLTFGEKLADLIHVRKVSQKELALKSGVSESSISKYITGTITNIGLDHVMELARALNVPATYFFNTSDEQKSSYALIEIFESAIDECHVADFIDYDFVSTPLSLNRVQELESFICKLQDVLPYYRRDNIEVQKQIIDFVMLLREYLSYLSLQMGTRDDIDIGLFFCLPNIDLSKVLIKVTESRERLNGIYGLISGGGTLSAGR